MAANVETKPAEEEDPWKDEPWNRPGRDGHARPVKDDVTYIDAVPEEDGYVCEVKGWWDRTDWNWTKEEKQAFADKYDDTVGTIEKVDENIKMCHRFGISLEEFEADKIDYNIFGKPKKCAIDQDYLFCAKHMRDFIETARTGVTCDQTCTRQLLHCWGTIKPHHYDEFIAFLKTDDCILETIQLMGDTAIGAAPVERGVERLMECVVAKPLITNLQLMGAKLGVEGTRIVADALVASGLTQLDISCDCIGDEGAALIARAWEAGTRLTHLTLVNDDGPIKVEGAKALASALTNLQKAGTCCLFSLNLQGNKIGVAGCNAIAAALGEFPEELDIKDNFIGDGCAAGLADAMGSGRSSLKFLDLIQNDLTKDAARILAPSFKTSKVECLHIHWNEIGTAGGLDFADMLATGESQLKELYLCDNEIGPEAVRRFCKAIGQGQLEVLDLMGNPCSVECAKELAMCNHTADKPLKHLELGLFSIEKEQLEAEERE